MVNLRRRVDSHGTLVAIEGALPGAHPLEVCAQGGHGSLHLAMPARLRSNHPRMRFLRLEKLRRIGVEEALDEEAELAFFLRAIGAQIRADLLEERFEAPDIHPQHSSVEPQLPGPALHDIRVAT